MTFDYKINTRTVGFLAIPYITLAGLPQASYGWQI